MAYLGKEFKFEKQENFETFINDLPESVPAEYKQKALASRPTQKVVLNGDTYTIYTINPSKTTEISFKNGVEFDERVREDVTAKTTVTVSGNTFTQVQVGPIGTVTIKREFSDNELIVTISRSGYNGVAKRFYKA